METLVAVGRRASDSPARRSETLPPADQPSWTERKQLALLPNGISIAYVEMGNPLGRPVVLLHGYTDTSRVWSIVAPYLGSFRLIIPDQRGHGNSSKPKHFYAPGFYVQDLLLLMDELRIERAAIVGSSMGSMIAQLFAAEHPDRVRSITLAGSTALPALTRGDWLWSSVTDADRPPNRDANFLAGWSPRASPTPVDAEFCRYFDQEMAEVPAHVWRSVIRELSDFPIGRHAEDVKAPVLILSGGKDPLFGPQHHVSLVQAYPQAEAHVFADLGHNLVVERPDQVGPTIADFLRRTA